jgi:hypothetical protein
MSDFYRGWTIIPILWWTNLTVLLVLVVGAVYKGEAFTLPMLVNISVTVAILVGVGVVAGIRRITFRKERRS